MSDWEIGVLAGAILFGAAMAAWLWVAAAPAPPRSVPHIDDVRPVSPLGTVTAVFHPVPPSSPAVDPPTDTLAVVEPALIGDDMGHLRWDPDLCIYYDPRCLEPARLAGEGTSSWPQLPVPEPNHRNT